MYDNIIKTNLCVIQPLTTQNVALASPGSLLELQNLKPYPDL